MSMKNLILAQANALSSTGDPYANNEGVILNMDSLPFIDLKGHEVVNVGVMLGQSLHSGAGSAVFNGSSYLVIRDASESMDLEITFECTFEKTEKGAMYLFSTVPKPGYETLYWSIFITDTAIVLYSSGSIGSCNNTAYFNFQLNTRYTIAISVKMNTGGFCKIAINGIQQIAQRSGNLGAPHYTSFLRNRSFHIGRSHSDNSFPFKGRIDAVRVTHGVARYLTNYEVDYSQPYSLE